MHCWELHKNHLLFQIIFIGTRRHIIDTKNYEWREKERKCAPFIFYPHILHFSSAVVVDLVFGIYTEWLFVNLLDICSPWKIEKKNTKRRKNIFRSFRSVLALYVVVVFVKKYFVLRVICTSFSCTTTPSDQKKEVRIYTTNIRVLSPYFSWS